MLSGLEDNNYKEGLDCFSRVADLLCQRHWFNPEICLIMNTWTLREWKPVLWRTGQGNWWSLFRHKWSQWLSAFMGSQKCWTSSVQVVINALLKLKGVKNIASRCAEKQIVRHGRDLLWPGGRLRVKITLTLVERPIQASECNRISHHRRSCLTTMPGKPESTLVTWELQVRCGISEHFQISMCLQISFQINMYSPPPQRAWK